ncbi:MAG TPA: cupin domain-containing protein [Thermohalobaculum sp.]|nr:cupin domain-containing protein [Thermohalobaculum sp.]
MRPTRFALMALLLAAACTACAPGPAPVATVEPVLETGETVLGQPIAWPGGTPQVTAVIVSLLPGAETGWHTHPVPLFGWMLEGELTVDYGDAGTRTYRRGEALMEAIGTPHNGRNDGPAPARILAVFLGAEGVANSEAVE